MRTPTTLGLPQQMGEPPNTCSRHRRQSCDLALDALESLAWNSFRICCHSTSCASYTGIILLKYTRPILVVVSGATLSLTLFASWLTVSSNTTSDPVSHRLCSVCLRESRSQNFQA